MKIESYKITTTLPQDYHQANRKNSYSVKAINVLTNPAAFQKISIPQPKRNLTTSNTKSMTSKQTNKKLTDNTESNSKNAI